MKKQQEREVFRFRFDSRNVVCIAVLSLISLPGAAEVGREVSLSASAQDGEAAKKQIGRPNHRNLNLHLATGGAFAVGEDLDDAKLGNIGGQITLGMDFGLSDLFAFSILGGYSGYALEDQGALQDLFIGAGLQMRLLVDHNGALGEEGGNALGNLWVDAHIAYHYYEADNHGGFNLGIGYEFSIAKDLNLGPYMRFQYTPWGDDLKYATFAFGFQISFAGQLEPDDRDQDSIEDSDDKCPDNSEDKDGFEDEDGCPDIDNDGDGILDVGDECPSLAGVADKNGCPENDNDRDGILNEVDKCPVRAEDKDGFEDEDGCPDTDNDQDGISDTDDKCPNKAEDKDAFEDEDGCPDKDNDDDGVIDAKDRCPDEPETKNGKDDEDGCPDLIRVDGPRIKILQKIYFATKKDTILERSYPVLEEVAEVIKRKKEIEVRIESHTDDKGPQKKNQRLSELRAEAVKQFLVEHGVDEKRLLPQGLGESKPIADNKTKDGREENRRIEFKIVGLDDESPNEEPSSP
ncbi:MAG: OmpA family protein [Proteobacteria bacterium]|nr:OmpA family protein [Pseudomonadota bacterium]